MRELFECADLLVVRAGDVRVCDVDPGVACGGQGGGGGGRREMKVRMGSLGWGELGREVSSLGFSGGLEGLVLGATVGVGCVSGCACGGSCLSLDLVGGVLSSDLIREWSGSLRFTLGVRLGGGGGCTLAGGCRRDAFSWALRHWRFQAWMSQKSRGWNESALSS